MAKRGFSFATEGGKRESSLFMPVLYHGNNKNANLFISTYELFGTGATGDTILRLSLTGTVLEKNLAVMT